MPFLKSIKAKGFKSFATEIVIDFNKNMTSFIGPNGSGKSNIVDAIKWTIGEQSVKQLRGDDKSNLIFMGSKDMGPANEAFVELTFDNKNRILDIDRDIVTVARKQIRKNNQNFYYLNGEETRLKDIHELFLDTGLSKGSLGIISQGTINWFSDAKPEDRKKIFQDAAGIGKYFKNKLDSLNLLDKSSQTLGIITNDLNNKRKRKDELEKLVNKYESFIQKEAELKELELTFLAKFIGFKKQEINNLTVSISEAEEKINQLKSQSDFNVKNNSALFEKIKANSDKISQLNIKIRELQQQRTELTTKIQIMNSELESDLNSDNLEKRLAALEEILKQYKVEKATKEKINEELISKSSALDSEIEQLKIQRQELGSELSKKTFTLNQAQYELKNLYSIKENSSDRVVKEILAVRKSYTGIVDAVSNLVKVDRKYELAIGLALSNSTKSIVTLNEQTAMDVISYLKKNQIGNATFLPIDKVKSKKLSNDVIAVAKNQKGYVDTANNLVKIEDKYRIIADHLLGNIIISENLESATKIAHMLDQRFKIITLEGDIKNAGGSISGGFRSNKNAAIFNIDEKIEEQQKLVETLVSEENNLRVSLKTIEGDYEVKMSLSYSNKSTIENNKTSIKTLEDNIMINSQYYDELKRKVAKPNAKDTRSSDSLKGQLVKIENELALLEPEQNTLADVTKKLNEEHALSSDTNNAIANQINGLITQKSDFETKKLTIQNDIDSKLSYLVETYEMSEELLIADYSNKPTIYSDIELQQKILDIKQEIKSIGNIDKNVITEYETIAEEYAQKEKEYNDAKDAVDQIQGTIEQLDHKAKNDLKTTVLNINKIAPSIFQRFYPGAEVGTCEIKFTDEENILDSGIEVVVQLPGKKRINLSLLSGGEKTLVALTILFAILKSAKFPLIILDEAEAALDELNVEFFATIIKEYSLSNQFLIITHRTGTMKVTEELYGVTMQDHGISIVIKDTIENFNKYFKEEHGGK